MRTDETPRSLARPKHPWMAGRRRSKPTTMTRRFVHARVTARLATVVVLPSEELGLVTWITVSSLSICRNCSDVRSER